MPLSALALVVLAGLMGAWWLTQGTVRSAPLVVLVLTAWVSGKALVAVLTAVYALRHAAQRDDAEGRVRDRHAEGGARRGGEAAARLGPRRVAQAHTIGELDHAAQHQPEAEAEGERRQHVQGSAKGKNLVMAHQPDIFAQAENGDYSDRRRQQRHLQRPHL